MYQLSLNEIPLIKYGYIYKQGQLFKNWKNRYFILNEGILKYYERAHPMNTIGINEKGSITSLKDKSIVIEDDILSIVGGKKRDLTIRFFNDEEKNEWLTALNEHITYCNRKE